MLQWKPAVGRRRASPQGGPTVIDRPSHGPPPTLARLLAAPSDSAQELAWEEFLAAHTGILLHACRTFARDRDEAMDGFSHVIGELRRNGYARLKAYVPDGRTRFSTWLVVVARRLLLDEHRRRYGRSRTTDDVQPEARQARRRLEDLVATEIDPEQLTTDEQHDPDVKLRRDEMARAIRAGLDALDPQDRLLIALRFEDERPVREIAAELRFPTVFHVYRRLSTVLAALRRSLERQGVREAQP